MKQGHCVSDLGKRHERTRDSARDRHLMQIVNRFESECGCVMMTVAEAFEHRAFLTVLRISNLDATPSHVVGPVLTVGIAPAGAIRPRSYAPERLSCADETGTVLGNATPTA